MLNYLIKLFVKKPKKSVTVEEVIYNMNKVYIFYSIVRNNFRYCMQNRLLTRNDVLAFKALVNKSVNQNEFIYETFENDAHEIYKKLKSKSISKNNMLKLNAYLENFITINRPVSKPESAETKGNLIVIK